jgi:CheY-like chemotaxis protein
MPVVDGFARPAHQGTPPWRRSRGHTVLVGAPRRRPSRARDGVLSHQAVTRHDLLAAIDGIAAASSPLVGPAPRPARPFPRRPRRTRGEQATPSRAARGQRHQPEGRAPCRAARCTPSSPTRAAPPGRPRYAFDLVLMDVEMPDSTGWRPPRPSGPPGPGTRAPASPGRPARTRPIETGASRSSPSPPTPCAGRRRALAAGMDAFLTKPFKAAELTSMLARFTGGPQA